ncbi:MAG: hypothetical protein V8Q93_08240 [Blautia faecis]
MLRCRSHALLHPRTGVYPHTTLLGIYRTGHVGSDIGIVEVIRLMTGKLQA